MGSRPVSAPSCRGLRASFTSGKRKSNLTCHRRGTCAFPSGAQEPRQDSDPDQAAKPLSLSLSHPQAARNLESTLAPALLYSPSTSSTPTRKCREPSHSGCGGRKTNLKPYGVDAQKARSGSRYWDQKVHTTFPTSPRAAPLESARYISHKPSRRFLRKCRLHFPQVLAPFL